MSGSTVTSQLRLVYERISSINAGATIHFEGGISLGDKSIAVNQEYFVYIVSPQPQKVVLIDHTANFQIQPPIDSAVRMIRCSLVEGCQDWAELYRYTLQGTTGISDLGFKTYLNNFVKRALEAGDKTKYGYEEVTLLKRDDNVQNHYRCTAFLQISQVYSHPGMVDVIGLENIDQTYIGMLKGIVDAVRQLMGFDLNLGYFQTADSQSGIISTLSNYGIPVNLIPATAEFLLRRSSNALAIADGESYFNEYTANNVLNDAQLLASLMFMKGSVMNKPIKSAVMNMMMYAYAQRGFDQVIRSVYGGVQQALPDVASTAIALPLRNYPNTNQVFTYFAGPYAKAGLGFLADLGAMYVTKKFLGYATRNSPLLTNGISMLSTMNNNRLIRQYVPISAQLASRALWGPGTDYMGIVESGLSQYKDLWYDRDLGVGATEPMRFIKNYLLTPTQGNYAVANDQFGTIERNLLKAASNGADLESIAIQRQLLSELQEYMTSMNTRLVNGLSDRAKTFIKGITMHAKTFPGAETDYYNTISPPPLQSYNPAETLSSDWPGALNSVPASQQSNYMTYLAGIAIASLLGYGLYNSGDYISNLYNNTTSYYPQRKRDIKYNNKTSPVDDVEPYYKYKLPYRFQEVSNIGRFLGHFDHNPVVTSNTYYDTLPYLNKKQQLQIQTQPQPITEQSSSILGLIRDNLPLIAAMTAGAAGAGYMASQYSGDPSPLLDKIERLHNREYPVGPLTINKELRRQKREFRSRDIKRLARKIQEEEEDEWQQKRKAKPKHIGNGHGIKRRKH